MDNMKVRGLIVMRSCWCEDKKCWECVRERQGVMPRCEDKKFSAAVVHEVNGWFWDTSVPLGQDKGARERGV